MGKFEIVAPLLPPRAKNCMFCSQPATTHPGHEYGAPFALCDADKCATEFAAMEKAMDDHIHQQNIDEWAARDEARSDMIALLQEKKIIDGQTDHMISTCTYNFYYIYLAEPVKGKTDPNEAGWLGLYDYGALNKLEIVNRADDGWYPWNHPEIDKICDYLNRGRPMSSVAR